MNFSRRWQRFATGVRKRGRAARRLAMCATALVLAGLGAATTARAQQYNPNLYAGMRWRQIGPFRAGRVTAVAGVTGNPAVYYIGTAGGGIWETKDAGVTWHPIFDQEHVASIGAMEAAPSDPKILYVGTGDLNDVGEAMNQGDGMYKSTDGGKTWQHIGLAETHHIGDLWIDPHDPNVVLVAALGHTYAKNAERGVFKTTDGGKTWRKVLYTNDETGAINLAFDPTDAKIGFAALWKHYAPLGNPLVPILGNSTGSAIYKTTDGGNTWTPAGTKGLPTKKVGRIGLAVAPGGRRVYAIIGAQPGAGLYRSDDGGETWTKTTRDHRIVGNGYFGRVYLDPKDPNIVYVMQTSMYRSTNGGKTFLSFKGSPGGDDDHVLWIDPANTKWMIMGSDQGGTVSLDGGKTWSSWYNQPTGQIYHLSVDNRWPFWVYGTQQDSGSIAGLSRGNYGTITMLDWDPVAGYEFGYIVPDPLDPNLIYAGGPGRGVVRIGRTNQQVRPVSVNVSRDGDYRTAENPPLVFSPEHPHVLYEATQFVLETTDGGMTWKKISPDLTKQPGAAKTAKEKKKKKTLFGDAINTLAASPVRAGVLWAGTTNGMIQLTRDAGKSWKDVSPKGLGKGSLVSMIEPSHFSAAGAYVAVDRFEVNDFRPHIYRTDDYGKTWQQVDAGIPDRSIVRVVREDPVRKDLLYAGTETGVYVSFDNGDRWQSLQLNLPTVSVRDVKVHDSDLVICTYGRAFWILDDVTPLRQIDARVASSQAYLFRPKQAIRVRRDQNGDTPFPPEMPAGKNPPAGAIIDYYLKSEPAGNVTLAIYTSQGRLVRNYSSAALKPRDWPPPPVPSFWLLKPKPLPKGAGMNRFVWNLRYTSPKSLRHNYPISAVVHDTPADPRGPFVVPGKYKVQLTVDGRTYTQPLEVKLDPRVSTTQAQLEKQLALAQRVVGLMGPSYQGHQQVAALRKELAVREKSLEGKEDAKKALAAVRKLDAEAEQIEGGGPRPYIRVSQPQPSFGLVNGELGSLLGVVEAADMPPTEGMRTAYTDYCRDLGKVGAAWTALETKGLAAVNAQLADVHAETVTAPAGAKIDPSCGK